MSSTVLKFSETTSRLGLVEGTRLSLGDDTAEAARQAGIAAAAAASVGDLVADVNAAGAAQVAAVESAASVVTGSVKQIRLNSAQHLDEWFAHSRENCRAAYDVSKGVGVGYTLSGANIASILDLSGNGPDLTPSGASATVATINDLDAAQMTARYSGIATNLADIFAGAEYECTSIHYVLQHTGAIPTNLDAAAISSAGAGQRPSVGSRLRANGSHQIYSLPDASGSDTQNASNLRLVAADELLTVSETIVKTTAQTFRILRINGQATFINEVLAPPIGGVLTGLNQIDFGGRQGFGNVTGKMAALGIWSGKTHTIYAAAEIDRRMMLKWMPKKIVDVFKVFEYGQSLTKASQVTPLADRVSFEDGDAFRSVTLTSSGYLPTVYGIGQDAVVQPATESPMVYWFMQRVFAQTGIKPFYLGRTGNSGKGLTPDRYGADTIYLQPPTFDGDRFGETSIWKEQIEPSQTKAQRLLDLSPAFNVVESVLIFTGLQREIARIKDYGLLIHGDFDIMFEEIRKDIGRGLSALHAAAKRLGFNDLALLNVAFGADSMQAATFEPVVRGINQVISDFDASNPDAMLIYDKRSIDDYSNWTLDDLTYDPVTFIWQSGRARYDDVHPVWQDYRTAGATGGDEWQRRKGRL